MPISTLPSHAVISWVQLSDEDDLQEDSEATMGVTSSLSKSTSTLFQNSTSTLFGNAERLRGSQQEPFISAAHSRSNFGIDGPGPARVRWNTT